MKAKTFLFGLCASIALTSTAMAHPVHGGPAGGGLASGLLHPWLGLDHLLAMITVGLLAVQMGGRAIWVLPVTFVGSMILGGLLGVGGWELRFVEAGIAVSVIALGGALAVGRPYPLAAAAIALGLFGIFHGHAHGIEMPAMSAAVYFAGFTLGTALLHLVGLGIGYSVLRSQRLAPALRLSGAAVACFGLLLLLGMA